MGIETPGVQYTSHKYKNNQDEYDNTIKIADKDTHEEDVHHPQLTSSTKRRIYKLRPRKPRKHPVLGNYAHAQVLHYEMTQYLPRKVIKKFKKIGDAEVEK